MNRKSSGRHSDLIYTLLEKSPGVYPVSMPIAAERQFWNDLDRELRYALISEGEKKRNEPWSVMLMSDYREFSENGNRANFEEIQFSRRIKLSALVMAECAEHRGRFLDDIINGIYLILGEPGWCLPAHNSYIRDFRIEPVPDMLRPVVDLFAAETAVVLAVTEKLLRKELLGVSPFISTAINDALMTRIFIPYENEDFWWKGDGIQRVNNWTVWITANLMMTALTREENFFGEPGRLMKLMVQFASSIDFFLDEYSLDGACDEGAQYYSHAALCLYDCLDLLDNVTCYGMGDAFKDKRIRNIADFIYRMYVGNNYYLNFADCSAKPGRRGARDYLFGKKCGLDGLQALAATDYLVEDWDDRIMVNEHNLWYRLIQCCTHRDMLEVADDLRSGWVKPDRPGDCYFESTQMMVARDTRFVLAAKAGNNGENHNHNDVGSVIIYKDTRPLIIDLGVETYTAKTFSANRYELWTMQSQYHNLPTFICGEEMIQQKEGREACAEDVRCSLQDDICELKADISPAYADKRIWSYIRKVTFVKNRYIRIHDELNGTESEGDGATSGNDADSGLKARLSFITYETPEYDRSERAHPDFHDTAPGSDGLKLSEARGREGVIRIGRLGTLTIRGTEPENIKIETLRITDDRLRTAWQHDCYRILIPMSGNETDITVE